MNSIIGIDPGVRGGVAVLSFGGHVLYVQGFKPTMSEMDFSEVLSTAVGTVKAYGGVAYIEKVGYIRGDGGQGSFTFGQVNGILKGFLMAKGVPRRYVAPQLWQARMGCLTGGNKNVSKARAAELFPEIKVTHMIADALLIARYGYLVEPLDDPRGE